MTQSVRLKRLHFRSWHRGCKETDLILGHFADSGLAALDATELDLYERLLEENDADIWNWLTGKEAPVEYKTILEKLKAATKTSLRGGNADEAIQ